VVAKSKQPVRAPAESLSVRCGEEKVTVAVKKDFLGNGQITGLRQYSGCNSSILKTNPAEVAIQCHFQRRHYVSSNAMKPLWKTFAFEMQAKRQLHFSLRLMAEDWQSHRPSNEHFVRDMIHIEAAVLQGHHVPLRIFVDSCVVTVNPDPTFRPRYPFINNHGCLTDAKLTGAQSYFLPRSQEDKLHFQLKAFKFKQDDRNS
ncbi:hypothetical protein XENORESO_016182, partial [Xenotaenia resolanae]